MRGVDGARDRDTESKVGGWNGIWAEEGGRVGGWGEMVGEGL